MEVKATIADINVSFNHIHKSYFDRLYSEYLNEFTVPDLRLTFNSKEITVPYGETIFTDGTVTLKQQNNDKKVLYNIAEGLDVLYAMTYNSNCNDIVIDMSSKYKAKNLSLEQLEYFLTGRAYNLATINSGGLIFHSSCIEFENEAICFSAPSGTGKSTQTGLWKDYFGDKVKYINDDKPVIRFDDSGKAIAYGAPYSGKNFINSNISAPVKAVVFIERAETNSIRQINGAEAVFKIIDQLITFKADKAIMDKLITNAEKFILSVPTYVLSCNISDDAVKVCYNELYKK